MRKVEYKKDNVWIPGRFHQWGLEAISDKTSETVAIIEKSDGEIITVFPTDIKFLNETIKITLKTYQSGYVLPNDCDRIIECIVRSEGNPEKVLKWMSIDDSTVGLGIPETYQISGVFPQKKIYFNNVIEYPQAGVVTILYSQIEKEEITRKK